MSPEGRKGIANAIWLCWFYATVLDSSRVLTRDRAYFQLTSGIARWLYRLARKHAGKQPDGGMCSILAAALVLRVLDLHVPPALAVGLLPFVMAHPSFRFPLAVVVGTGIETMAFLAWRRFARSFAARAG